MNNKKLSMFVFGLLALQLVMPNYSASEVTQPVAQQAEVKYAPTNPTPAQVRASAPTDIVNIPDPALEQAIRMTIGTTGEPLTVADMESLIILSTYGTDLSDLTGMEYAVNLSYLDILECKVSDLSPLSDLNKLTRLTIIRNQVSDITPISRLPKLTFFSADGNNISDLTPFAGNTVLQNIMLPNNNITDISPVSEMPALQVMQLFGNHISDVSPLTERYNNGTLLFADITSQTVNGPDKVVYTGDEYSFDIIKTDGVKAPVVLGTPTYGVNNFTGVTFDESIDKIPFNGSITQKVTYITLRGTETDIVNEGTPMNDAQLIALFNVVSAENKTITVDQSAVNYDVPGTYDIVFNNGIDTVTSKLTVKNIAPTITLTTNTVTIKAGETVADYITTFGAVATEFTDGDLTTSITVDDSKVNYNKAGTYTVTLKVTDAEGIEVSTTGTVVIEGVTTVTPEEPKSETTKSETTESEVTESEATESETTSDVKAMTDNNKSLASTGYFTTTLVVVFTALVAMVVTVKKTLMSKN